MQKSKINVLKLLVLGVNGLFVILATTIPVRAATEISGGQNLQAVVNGQNCPYDAQGFHWGDGIAQWALTQVGNPQIDDKTPYDNYSGNYWCAAFARWTYSQAKLQIAPSDPELNNSRKLLEWFSSYHKEFTNPYYAAPGDIVVWKHTNSDTLGHTGIVLENDCSNGIIKTIEGNTPSNSVNIFTYTYEGIKSRYVIEIQNGQMTRIGTHGGFELYGFGRW